MLGRVLSRTVRAGWSRVVMALVCGTCAIPATAAGDVTVNPATYSFITVPTDQLGVPGYAAGSELTPSLGIYTGQAEVDWRLGPGLRALGVTGRTREGGMPVFHAERVSGGVRYRLISFATVVGDAPVDVVRVVMHNGSARARTAAWASQLGYSGGGLLGDGQHAFRFTPLVAADPTWRYLHVGRELLRAGQLLEVVPSGGAGTAGRVSYRRRLAPGRGWTLDFLIPVSPEDPVGAAGQALARSSPGQLLGATRSTWRRFFAQAMSISVPESKVTQTFYASLATLAQSRYPAPAGQTGWIQTPNKLGYNAFFIRDAAFIARAFDLVDLHAQAAADLAYFPEVENSDGLFESQPGELDGQGEALWALGQHAAWSGPGQQAYARGMLPAVARGVDWLARACAGDPDGLVPATSVDDNELASGHITGDDFLAADGLAAAIGLAREAGRPDLARAWQTQLTTFLSHLHSALARAERVTGGWIPPTLEASGGQSWGNLWMTYPAAVALSPRDPAVSATLAHERAGFRQGIATYRGMLHDYLGFRVLEGELQRGDQETVINGLYAELAHTTATDGGFETDVPVHGSRSPLTNLAPHGWFAAEYVTLLRNMLVREVGTDRVDIMAALSPDWLKPGETVRVSGAPSTAGSVSYRLVSFPGGARLSWSARLRAGVTLAWPLPAATGQRRTLMLHGSRGTLTVHWRLRGPVPSFVKTVAGVLAFYGHGG